MYNRYSRLAKMRRYQDWNDSLARINKAKGKKFRNIEQAWDEFHDMCQGLVPEKIWRKQFISLSTTGIQVDPDEMFEFYDDLWEAGAPRAATFVMSIANQFLR